jgi:hypothetical protein
VNVAGDRRLAPKILVEKKNSMNKEAIGTLTGKYFHSVKTDRETIEWQGKFLGLASPGLYRVQLFEWLTGCESDQLLVPATDMRYWRVYDTQEQLLQAYETYARRREANKPPQDGVVRSRAFNPFTDGGK